MPYEEMEPSYKRSAESSTRLLQKKGLNCSHAGNVEGYALFKGISFERVTRKKIAAGFSLLRDEKQKTFL